MRTWQLRVVRWLRGNKTDPSHVISEAQRGAPYIFPLQTRKKYNGIPNKTTRFLAWKAKPFYYSEQNTIHEVIYFSEPC